jgi:Uma2 family endonuclease
MRRLLVTAADLQRLSLDNRYRYELDAGLLVVREPAGHRHGRIVARIYAALTEHVKQIGAGEVIAFETGFLLSESPDVIRSPDVAYMCVPRDRAEEGYVRGAPDLVVEVLSPFERDENVNGKVRDYLAAGTRMIWLFDPERTTVTRVPSDANPETLPANEVLLGSPVLAEFSCPIAPLFAD